MKLSASKTQLVYKMVLLIYVLILILAVSVIIFRRQRRRLYELASKIPGSDGFPLIGVLTKFLNLELKDYVYELRKLCLKTSSISKSWFGPQLVVFTEDPEVINTVVNSKHCQNKPDLFYKGLYTENGLVTINNKVQEKHRKVLNKAFVPSMLQQFIPIFNEKSKVCVEKMRENLDGGEFNVFHYIGMCTLETFFKGHLNHDRNFYGTGIEHIIEE